MNMNDFKINNSPMFIDKVFKPPHPPHGSLGCCQFSGGGSVVVDLFLVYFPLIVGVCVRRSFVVHNFVSFLLLQSS